MSSVSVTESLRQSASCANAAAERVRSVTVDESGDEWGERTTVPCQHPECDGLRLDGVGRPAEVRVKDLGRAGEIVCCLRCWSR